MCRQVIINKSGDQSPMVQNMEYNCAMCFALTVDQSVFEIFDWPINVDNFNTHFYKTGTFAGFVWAKDIFLQMSTRN